ncbi:MAG: hypothetical protein LKK00_00700 [Intestinimonas sp.]|nr:hypothetical protein [Intestinimonas sp.]
MPEKVVPGPVQDNACIREAVCIHTMKIFDSCKDKDCIDDLRFYPTKNDQAVVDRAISIRAGTAELLHVYIDVDPAGYHRGFYTVDVRYFYRITADAFVGAPRPVEVSGLAVFDKRVILFGSEGSAKVFTSAGTCDGPDPRKMGRTNLPIAVVEAVDPIVLSMRLVDVCDHCPCDSDLTEVPPSICACFGSDLCFSNEGRRVYVTLGQFSIIRLERDTQLLIPAYDYCMPDKECTNAGSEDDPCEIFSQVNFPVNEFFPPNELSGGSYPPFRGSCGNNCN